MARTRKSQVNRRRGAAAIEYALILPVLLIFVLGLMDAGRLLWTYTTLYRAAEAAARCGAVNATDCGTTAQIQSRAKSEAWGLTINSSAFAVTKPSCGVQVKATYDFTFVIPMVGAVAPLGTVTLNATACYPL